MYDRKVVRRRRAALAVFVALSIAILTAYFGESGGGFFHALQRGAQEAFAPIETGASRALKPVRDFFGWVGDTFDAKEREQGPQAGGRAAARPSWPQSQTAQRDADQLKALVGLQATRTASRSRPTPVDRARDRPLADGLVLERRRSTRARATACA